MSKIGRVVLYVLCGTAMVGIAGYSTLHIWLAVRSQPHPRGPYLQSVTPDSVWVVWDTVEPSIGLVKYGLTSEFGQVAEEKEAALHHEVQLIGLKPYTYYYYQVDGGKAARFRTAAPSDHTDFRFVVYGDTRGGASVHRAIIKRAIDVAPDFALHTGDLVESGRATSEWDRFFRIEEPLLRTAPFYPTLGNHEDYDPKRLGSQYLDIFHLPDNELWYVFDYGNARFICLKSDAIPPTFFPGEEQLAWLEEQLASNEAPWLFVFFHVGLFTSRSEDFLETGMRDSLVPLFEQYGVDAVFMGHHHSYERIIVNGITYIVTGGGGASLCEMEKPEPGSQVAISAHHFTVIEVKDDRLFGRAIDRRGRVIDSFELLAEE
jgi:hypothetical protein